MRDREKYREMDIERDKMKMRHTIISPVLTLSQSYHSYPILSALP